LSTYTNLLTAYLFTLHYLLTFIYSLLHAITAADTTVKIKYLAIYKNLMSIYELL